MEENMNTGLEVTTDVSVMEEPAQEIGVETSSGPSKGLVALVVGGVAAIAVGATIAIKRNKKKKAEKEKSNSNEAEKRRPLDEEIENLEPEIEEKSE